MAASVIPKAEAHARSLAFHRRCQERRSRMIINAAPSTLTNATPAGAISSNR